MIFTQVNRRNFNRRLKAILAKLGAPKASRYSPRAFRRGSAHEMNETGPPFPPSRRTVRGFPTQSRDTLIWRLTWKRTRGSWPASIWTPNRRKRYYQIFGPMIRSPLPAGSAAHPKGIGDFSALSLHAFFLIALTKVKSWSGLEGWRFFGIRMGIPKPTGLRPPLPPQTTSGDGTPFLFAN